MSASGSAFAAVTSSTDVTAADYRSVLGRVPTAVCVVTATTPDAPSA